MKILQSVAVAASLSAPLFSQTLTREYRFDFADSELALGTTTAAAEAGASNYPIPEVDEGPLVQIVGLGFQMSGTQRAEADLVNATSSSVVASTGVRTPNPGALSGTHTVARSVLTHAPLAVLREEAPSPCRPIRARPSFTSTTPSRSILGLASARPVLGPAFWPLVRSIPVFKRSTRTMTPAPSASNRPSKGTSQ